MTKIAKLKLGRETVRRLSEPTQAAYSAPSGYFCSIYNCGSGNEQCFNTTSAYCTN